VAHLLEAGRLHARRIGVEVAHAVQEFGALRGVVAQHRDRRGGAGVVRRESATVSGTAIAASRMARLASYTAREGCPAASVRNGSGRRTSTSSVEPLVGQKVPGKGL